ncbi:PAM68 [Scenedesmus sp. PABB004]|nr:PAM68 [Scenedesmus sp. PABB004]
MLRRCSLAGAQTRLAPPSGRAAARPRGLVCAPLAAGGKGGKGGKPANVKVNKRGKVSSRPGPGSAALEEAQQLVAGQQAQPAAAPAAAAPAAAQQAQQAQQAPAAQQQAQQAPAAAQASVSETPQVVVDRMFRRVLTFAGAPVALGVVLFPLFWYLKVVAKVEYPLWVVYVTQATMFGGGLLGITYGILSTSWDPRREGTALGWTELQANLPILLSRNKQQQ